mmetsp:Transcript_41531/g.83846  ORF Transcript_41531/g.83846 Transcript_41531/m.83846 type:complete len:301 (+) Transcript_41531:55-957(+)
MTSSAPPSVKGCRCTSAGGRGRGPHAADGTVPVLAQPTVTADRVEHVEAAQGECLLPQLEVQEADGARGVRLELVLRYGKEQGVLPDGCVIQGAARVDDGLGRDPRLVRQPEDVRHCLSKLLKALRPRALGSCVRRRRTLLIAHLPVHQRLDVAEDWHLVHGGAREAEELSLACHGLVWALGHQIESAAGLRDNWAPPHEVPLCLEGRVRFSLAAAGEEGQGLELRDARDCVGNLAVAEELPGILQELSLGFSGCVHVSAYGLHHGTKLRSAHAALSEAVLCGPRIILLPLRSLHYGLYL